MPKKRDMAKTAMTMSFLEQFDCNDGNSNRIEMCTGLSLSLGPFLIKLSDVRSLRECFVMLETLSLHLGFIRSTLALGLAGDTSE